MYEALTESRSKAILFVCSCCRKRGSVSKCLCKFKLQCERTCEEQLASAHTLDEACDQLQRAEVRYKEEKSCMQQEITELHALLKTLGSMHETVTEWQESHQEVHMLTEQSGSDDSTDRELRPLRRTADFRQPPAFAELRSHLDKFTGKSGEGDFEIWLEDYVEATRDCGWDDEQRSHWFSWFITGPAKLTWQHTLSAEDKSLW